MSKTKKDRTAKRRSSRRSLPKTKIKFFLGDEEIEEALTKAELERSAAEAAVGREGTPEAHDRLNAAEEALEVAQAEYDAEVWVGHLRALRREPYAKLIDSLPPTPEQIEEAEKLLADNLGTEVTQAMIRASVLQQLPYDADRFPRALIERTLYFDPPLTQEEWEDEIEGIYGEESNWSAADLKALLTAAENVCNKASHLRR